MVDQAIIYVTAGRLAALDFSAENARIAELDAEIDRMNAAKADADRRRTEIREELASPSAGLNGAAIADRLLSGQGDVATASPSREMLENESAALASGARELMQRIDVATLQINQAQSGAR